MEKEKIKICKNCGNLLSDVNGNRQFCPDGYSIDGRRRSCHDEYHKGVWARETNSLKLEKHKQELLQIRLGHLARFNSGPFTELEFEHFQIDLNECIRISRDVLGRLVYWFYCYKLTSLGRGMFTIQVHSENLYPELRRKVLQIMDKNDNEPSQKSVGQPPQSIQASEPALKTDEPLTIDPWAVFNLVGGIFSGKR